MGWGGVALALLLPLLAARSAEAIIYADNLSQTNVGNSGIGDFGISLSAGSSFTTGNDSYSLNSVTASFSESAEGDLNINLYSNAGSEPGTLLESLSTTDDITGSPSNHLFEPNNLVTLDPTTTYWLIGESASGQYAWNVTNSTAETAIDGWTIGDGGVFSTNGGASWSPGNSSTVQFNVDATAASVPFEFSPGLGLLLMTGLFGGKVAYSKYRTRKIELEDIS